MEPLIRKHFGKNSKVNVVRYADDFVITASSRERAEEARAILIPFLAERGLELSEEKTLVTHIADGFNFLGWNFRKYRNGTLLIKPSKESVRNAVRKIREIILENGKAWSQDDIIRDLNPVLRGWTNYHRSAVSKKAFGWIGTYVFRTLWTWASRRHRDKRREWIMNRYWHRKGTRKWVFRTEDKELLYVHNVTIRRHVKVRNAMNPYTDRTYFELRKAAKNTELKEGFRSKKTSSCQPP